MAVCAVKLELVVSPDRSAVALRHRRARWFTHAGTHRTVAERTRLLLGMGEERVCFARNGSEIVR